ncbi:MAG: hypothetical protein Q8Q60_03915 [Candidatus Chromulinivorax sp.]|nr:hypothetical protein [Candidatus Chromulinivorax sp.]
MKNNIFFLTFMLIISSYKLIQAKIQTKKLPKTTVSQKITKKDASSNFIQCELYADLQTSPLNRPRVETKKELFTLAEYKKPNHYHAPNMNDWANDNPRVRTCDVGTVNAMGQSFSLTSSSPSSNDPFRKPLPGPR